MCIRFGCLTVIVFLGLTATPYSSSNETAAGHYGKGVELLNRGDWNNAGKEFKEAITIDPFFLDAHIKYQAVEYYYFEHKDIVLEEYQKLVELHPQSPLYHYLLSLIIAGDDKRQGELDRAIEIDSTFVIAYRDLISSLMRHKKFVEAEGLLNTALRHSPNSIYLLLEKQRLLQATEQSDEREKLLHYLVQHYPDSIHVSEAYFNLAQLTPDRDDKIKLLESAYNLHDPYAVPPVAVTSELFSQYAQRDSAKAVEFARNVIRSSAPIGDRRAPSGAWRDLYRFYISRKDTAAAIAVAHELEKSESPDPELYDYFANQLVSVDREIPLAFKYFEKAISLNTPENNFGYHSFGKISLTMLKGLSNSFEAYYRRDLGKTYFKLGNYQKALEQFQDATGKSEGAEPEIQFQLGKTLEKLGKPKDAIAAYVASLAIKEDAEVRSAVESLAGRESNLKVAIPERRIVDVDSAISAEQLTTARNATDFDLPDLKGINHSLKDFRGKIVVLDFWASWCGPCVAELPHLQKLADSLRNDKGVVFLAINKDLDSSVVREFIAKNKYTLTVLWDNKNVLGMYDLDARIPTTFVIDGSGKIRYRHLGFDVNENLEGMITEEIKLVHRMQ